MLQFLPFTFAAAALVSCLLIVPAGAVPRSAAIFPFEFVDLGQGSAYAKPEPDDNARLSMVTELLKNRLSASGTTTPVDLASAAPAIAKAPALRDCQTCAEEIARGAGAEIAIVGYVQKVSNLILNLNIKVSDARSGRVLAAESADIRGNTDESWTRGIEWLVKNRLLAKMQP